MEELKSGYLRRAAIGALVAVAVGCLAALLGDLALGYEGPFEVVADRHLPAFAIAAAPLLYLAFTGTRAWSLWLLALTMTSGFWALFLFVMSHSINGAGVNFGVALLMAASPFVTMTALTVAAGIRHNRKPDKETQTGLGCVIFTSLVLMAALMALIAAAL